MAPEEIGKIAIAYVQVFAREQARNTGQGCPSEAVDGELDGIIGGERVNRFGSDVENGELERLAFFTGRKETNNWSRLY